MTVDNLVSYILTLTPEQIDKVCERLPTIAELLEGSKQPITPPEKTSEDK
jgi:hypothetical protein